MKRRLRKKRHLGEYGEWGRQLVVARNRKDGFDEFLDAFVVEAVEANGCFCGGGGSGDRLDVIVELGRATDDRDRRLRALRDWLDARGDVASYQAGPEFDLWHGDCPELPSIGDDIVTTTGETAG
ncbi:MAG TPA: 50S ribosome-binding protein YggL [Candidatus Methanoperedens sp.]|nr:50S ribosome-binding protein YggL [Candidatus Methanoperedens sp.]